MQALNYFIAQKYVEAMSQIGQSPNARLVLMPMETSGLVGTIAGIAELARGELGNGAIGSGRCRRSRGGRGRSLRRRSGWRSCMRRAATSSGSRLGAAATAAISAAAGPLSVTAQIGIFAVASAVSCLGGYFVYRRRSARRTDDAALNRRGQLLLGTHGVACAAFVNGQGKVRLGDTVWLAEGAELAEGSPVVVTEVRGARVIVAEAGAVKS